MSWPMVPFGEILRLAPRELVERRDLPVMSITMRDGLVDQHEKFKKRIASSDISTYKVVRSGNLVVGFPIDEGVLGFQQRYEAAAVSPAYDIWEATGQHELDRQFFERVLRSPTARTIYAAKMRGTTNRRRTIPKEIFRQIEFPLPPLAEQKRIAGILDAADKLRARRRDALAQLDTLLQSTFLDMFGDPVTNPMGWEVKALQGLIQKDRPITYGILKPGPDTKDGIPYVRVVDIKNEKVLTEQLRRTTPAIASQYKRSQLIDGDLIMSIRGHVGRMAIVPPGASGTNITQDTARLALAAANATYVMQCLSTQGLQQHMARRTKGIAVKGINLGDVKKIPIPVPSLDLQHDFAAIVESVEEQKVSQRAHLAELDTLFAALQQRAFNGEL